jgi:hypothetical protein
MTDRPTSAVQGAASFRPPTPAIAAATEIDREGLLLQLRRKEGTWVDWGMACQQLKGAGMDPQSIFEATGFEPIHQNQIVVAAQVYRTVLDGEVPEAVLTYFEQRGSEVLYELRVLSGRDRCLGAIAAVEKGLDLDEVREMAKAAKEFSYMKVLPEDFEDSPGDATAYQYWRLARQKSDLQERSRLIARGLRFVDSATARRRIEQLLTDFAVVPAKPAPRLPSFRLESAEDVPRILPVVGKMPLITDDFRAVPLIEPEGTFEMVRFSGTGAWVAVPNWQVLMSAEDPVGVLCDGGDLPDADPDAPPEETLLIIDRAQRQWLEDSYFAVDREGHLAVEWFEAPTGVMLLGRVLVVLRPHRIFDQNFARELWQVDE